MSASLATVSQLSAYLQQPLADNDPSGALMLQIASGMVRDYLHSTLDYVQNDVVVCDPIDGSYVLLNELPIESVSKLETFDGTTWTIMAPSSYTVSTRIGMISGLPGLGITWPTKPGTWRVTYTHGFQTIPDTIQGVVLGVAARNYSSPASISSESLGGYSVKYEKQADGFTPLEKLALNRYVHPRIA
jgi:hypothetical protein